MKIQWPDVQLAEGNSNLQVRHQGSVLYFLAVSKDRPLHCSPPQYFPKMTIALKAGGEENGLFDMAYIRETWHILIWAW